MASPEKRIRDIAVFMIVISGMFLVTGLAAWGSSGPIIGELGQFMHAMNRVVLLPCGIIGVVAGFGLLRRWNWSRLLMIGVCTLTCVFALLVLIALTFTPLGTEPGESIAPLLTLKIVLLLFIAAPALVPIFWIRFLISKEVVELFRSRHRTAVEKAG